MEPMFASLAPQKPNTGLYPELVQPSQLHSIFLYEHYHAIVFKFNMSIKILIDKSDSVGE
jgi:hypothetical protein